MQKKKDIPLLKKRIDINPDFGQIAALIGGYAYKDDIFMIKISEFNKETIEEASSSLINNAIRLEALSVVLILEGSLTLSIDYNDITIPEKSMLILSPMNTITGSYISEGGRFFLLMVKREILDRVGSAITPNIVVPVTPSFVDFFRKPFFILEKDTFATMEGSFQILYHYLKDRRQGIKGYLIDYSLSIVMIEILNYLSENTELNLEGKPLVRKKELLAKFMDLVRTFGEREHNPSFYAGKLFISVQYLSLICKQETGRSTSKLLASNLAVRARNMLRTPGATIKQTAEALNFADQSSFGKFFRKETGMSPKKYLSSL